MITDAGGGCQDYEWKKVKEVYGYSRYGGEGHRLGERGKGTDKEGSARTRNSPRTEREKRSR